MYISSCIFPEQVLLCWSKTLISRVRHIGVVALRMSEHRNPYNIWEAGGPSVRKQLFRNPNNRNPNNIWEAGHQ